MVLKKRLGEILSDQGVVTSDEIRAALQKQKELSENCVPPERLERARLVSETRMAPDSIPSLGQILLEMGYVTRDQLEGALAVQEGLTERYRTLASEDLCSILDIGALVNSTLNLAEVLGLIMENANKVTHSEASTLMLVEEKTGDLVFSVPTGPTAGLLTDNRIPRGTGIAGWVAENERPALVVDAKADGRFYSEVDKITGIETRSILAVPLKAKSKLIGVLEVINKEDGTPFTTQDEVLLNIFATQAAMAIENARLYGELKEEYERRSRMERDLAETDKFRALGQLSSGIVHDFNNYLASMKGLVELSMMHLQDSKRLKQSMEQMLKATDRARDLAGQILVFSRKDDEKRVRVSAHQIVGEAIDFIKATLPPKVDLRPSISPDAGVILANPNQIQQALMNLCINASHAMQGRNGVIQVSLLPHEIKGSEGGGLQPGPYAKIIVSDNGCGMDSATLKKIFEPYFTTKQKGFGTGLGLSVVHGIIKGHNGSICVSSEPGKGTTFEILLPTVQ